jgi:REP element-mobilizing transposase RayT
MPYDRLRRHRRSIRLPEYDYASGAYFVTICTARRACLFGDVMDGRVRLSPSGRIVAEEWERSASVRPTIGIGAFVVMPNHLHGIVTIRDGEPSVGAHSNAPQEGALLRAPTVAEPTRRAPRTLGSFVGAFKGAATRRINALRDTPGEPVWQRNYYEHVIRDEEDYVRICAYIEDNPRRWAEDEYHPDRGP